MTIWALPRAGRRTIGAHGGVISPADGAGCHGVREELSWPNLSAPTFSRTGGRSSAAQRAAGSSGSGWNAVWEPSQILISRIREFWPDSVLEEDGFEPSASRPESSVSAAFRASVAADLHPYTAPLCTPWSRQSYNPLSSSWFADRFGSLVPLASAHWQSRSGEKNAAVAACAGRITQAVL
jgi:hypothetical protein